MVTILSARARIGQRRPADLRPSETGKSLKTRGLAGALPALALLLATPIQSAPAPKRAPAPGGAITAVAFSPDGRLLAVGRGGSVALLEPNSQRPVRTLATAAGTVTSLQYSYTGALLAVAGGMPGRSGVVEIWDVRTGRRLRTLTGLNDLVYGIALRPDERQLAAVSYDHQVWVWPMAGLAKAPIGPPRQLRDHTDSVFGVSFGANGKQLATAAADRTVKVWDAETGKRLFTLSEATADEYTVAYRPGGSQIAAAGVDRTLRVWNIAATGGTLARSAFAHNGPVLKVVYSRDGSRLFTCGEDRTVKEWDAETLEERGVYPMQPDWPECLAVSPNGRMLAVGRFDGTLALYDTSTRQPLQPAPQSKTAVVSLPHAGLPAANMSLARADDPESLHTGRRRFERCADPVPDAEIRRQPGNESFASAQLLSVPAVVSGVLWNGKSDSLAPSHYYRFHAARGETLTLDVLARRDGSPLDSEIEVLDRRGRPVERAVLRAVAQTEVTLSDRDSVSPGMRLIIRPEFQMRDTVLAGRELLQIYAMPKGPDDDYQFRSYRGQRLGLLGTTPEYHSIGNAVYRVEVHPAGSVFAPNGMPLVRLTVKNDDGGPLYGRDSYLAFTAPEEGEYTVRLTDVRGQQGEKFTYRLRLHAPRPDFKINVNPAALTAPKGGGALVTVECERYEGYEGPIAVRLEGLPPGFTASDAVIEPGETAAALRISTAAGAPAPDANSVASYRAVATADIGSSHVVRTIEPDGKSRRVSVGPAASVDLSTDVTEAAIRPGGQTVVEARITRLNGFKGRVPLDVRNLPYGVRVDDVGLNGILITEQETRRKFVLRCEPWVQPQTRAIYVSANVEGGVANAAPAIALRVESSQTAKE